MDRFIIDEQTYRDLNVFTENYKTNAIFNIFKSTRTMSARERLKEMMRNPSSNPEELKLRRDAIKYFYNNKVSLDIRNEEFDLIEFYLKFDKRKSKANWIDAAGDYLTRNSSNDYYIIKTGLKYLIKLIRYILAFIEDNTSDSTSEYLTNMFQSINLIIEGSVLKQSVNFDPDNLKFYQVNALDGALRGNEQRNMQTFMDYIRELDIFENIAIVTARLGLTFPVYDDKQGFEVSISGLFHPSISNAVRNDILINEKQNIVFLTGSNMAGKSSLLKSLGLVIYLAHLGFPVPADQMKTTVFSGLITTINLPDDLNEGMSHYYSEVKRVKEVSLKLAESKKLFVIFDELFRGTNVSDAFDASLLIISELTFIKRSAFLISTHIVELAQELLKYDNVSFQYMDTYFKDAKPVFTYKLLAGISTERLGMYIVLNEGIVEILKEVRRADKSELVEKPKN